MSSKKRKIDEECIGVQEKWKTQYFCGKVTGKAVCLICKQTIPIAQENIVRGHYNKNHALEYNEYEGKLREEKIKELEHSFNKRQTVSKSAKRISDAAIKASYMIAHEIALSGKSSWDGNFLKKCMLMSAGLICPDKRQEFADIHLSKNTIGKRICDISQQLSSQSRDKVKTFVAFSIAIDGIFGKASTELVVFIRGVSKDMKVTEEFVEVISIKETTTSEEIVDRLVGALDELGVDWSQAVSLSSDGVPLVMDIKTEVATKLKDRVISFNPGHEFYHLHSILHQEVLCSKVLNMKNVLDTVMNIIVSLQPDPHGSLYPMDIRRVCQGDLLKRFYGIHGNIHHCMEEAGKTVDELQDEEWSQDLAFLVDVKEHLDDLKKNIQGKSKLVTHFYDSIHAFELKLQLWERQLSSNDLTHFPTLKSSCDRSENPCDSRLRKYKSRISDLRKEFQGRLSEFKNLEKLMSIFRNPFSVNPHEVPGDLQLELIDLHCDQNLKEKFSSIDVQTFYKHLLSVPRYSRLKGLATKILSMFGSTYINEKFFRVWSKNKSVRCSPSGDLGPCLNPVLKIATSQSFSPDFDALVRTRRSRRVASPFSKDVTRNSAAAAGSGESSAKNASRSQDAHRVRKYPSLEEMKSEQSSSDDECLRKRRKTFKATKPANEPHCETSQCKEPEVYIDVAEHPEDQGKRRLSTEKDKGITEINFSASDWEFIQLKEDPDAFEDIREGKDACDVDVKQELDDDMEVIKQEHDVDITGNQ